MSRVKKIIRLAIMIFLPLILCAGVTLPVYAMSNEEKELFDMLGVEYTLDENGDFKGFIVDETSHLTVEQRRAIVQKYGQKAQVGEYKVYTTVADDPDIINVAIYDKNSKWVLIADDWGGSEMSTIYFDANDDFFALHYEDHYGKDLKSYAIGNMIMDEKYNHNPIEEYYKNEDGIFNIKYKTEGRYHYSYDENGELYQWKDYDTGITYDADDNPIFKHINTTDTAGLYESVPYDVADEVQHLVDANGGSFNIYREDLDGYITMPEISQLLYESGMARKLGVTLEEYRKEHDAYKEYTSKIVYGVSVRADILEVPQEHLWNTPEALEEGEITADISEDGIAEELSKLINDYRVENGLNPLDSSDSLLQQVADLRAKEATYVMDGAHSRPMGGNASDSFNIGENLAMISFKQTMSNEEIAQKIFEAWKKSQSHNSNMLHKDYKLGALGVQFVKQDGKLVVYVSNDFSRLSDYQNRISDTIKKRIEIGPQVPGNIESMEDYYVKLYGTPTPSLSNGDMIEASEKGKNAEAADEERADLSDSPYSQFSQWTTIANGSRCIMQPLTGDIITINGYTPAYVWTEFQNTPVGEQLKIHLMDENFKDLYDAGFGINWDVEYTNYKYAYFLKLDYVGTSVCIFTVGGTDTPKSGNLHYMGDGTTDTETGPQTGPCYVDKEWFGIRE